MKTIQPYKHDIYLPKQTDKTPNKTLRQTQFCLTLP